MRFILVALMLVAASASAQKLNDLPLYGGFPKTPAMIKADQEFVAEATQKAGSKEAALQNEIMRGWQYLQGANSVKAIRRFNQAYLIDSESADVYWGLGAALTQSGQYEDALEMFNRAYSLAPKNVRLVADIGMARTRYALGDSPDPQVQIKRLEAALLWFNVAERIDPSYPMIYANRAITLTFLQRYPEAWENVEQARSLDPYSVDPSLIKRLSEVYPRPERIMAGKSGQATQHVQAPQAPYIPEEKMEPRIREEAITGGPSVATSANSSPEATQAVSETKVIPGPVAVEFVPDSSSQAEQQLSTQRRLHVIGGEPVNARGPDKRDCLSLPTNDQIIRCVYPN